VQNGNKILVQAQKVTILNGSITYNPAGIANAGGIAQPVSRSYNRVAGRAFQDFCGNVPVGGPYRIDGTPYVAVGVLRAYEPLQVDDLEASGEFSPAPAQAVGPIITQQVLAGGENYANGLLVGDYDPELNGAVASLLNIPGQIDSFTVYVNKAGTTPSGTNRVVVSFSGLPKKLFLTDGDSFSWSIAQDAGARTDFINPNVTITAEGNSAFSLSYTTKAS
jgi:hypothetical protein